MTERERLIELIQNAVDGCARHWAEVIADHLLANGVIVLDTSSVDVVTNREPIRTAFGMPLDELSDLIRAKQQGNLIVPPCKVGDTVYISENPYTFLPLRKVVEGKTISLHQHEYGLFVRVLFDTKKINGCRDYKIDKFGKSVFLSREEAEKALAERSKG